MAREVIQRDFLYFLVGNNDNLIAVPKARKLTYVEIAKASLAVDKQNTLIANGIDPLDQLKIKQ